MLSALMQLFVQARRSILVLNCSFFGFPCSPDGSALVGVLGAVDFNELKIHKPGHAALMLTSVSPLGERLAGAFGKVEVPRGALP